MSFFPATMTEQVIKNTGGCKVVYRGQEGWFHRENPTFDDIFATVGSVQGHALTLVGDSRVYPNLEENTLITVDGTDYLVGEWETPGDGGVVWIALKTSTRT